MNVINAERANYDRVSGVLEKEKKKKKEKWKKEKNKRKKKKRKKGRKLLHEILFAM